MIVSSLLIYIGLLLFCWWCAHKADRTDKTRYKWLIILALTLFAGLRDSTVGIDTANYLSLFRTIGAGRFYLAYGLETSFKYIVFVIMRLIPSAQFVMGLCAFITHWCILSRFWELRKSASFPCMVLCYYMSFYFLSLNAVRQFVGIGIIFYCSRYLEQKKTVHFIIGVLVASLFHRSALVGLGFLAANCLRWRELPKMQKLLYVCLVLTLPALLVASVQVLERYSKYFANPSMDIGLMLPVKLAFLIMSLIFLHESYRRSLIIRGVEGKDTGSRYQLRITAACYTAALFLAALGYVFPMVERISWYYYLFECVYFGMLIRGRKRQNKLMFCGYVAFVIGYGFLYSMANNSQGTMPYSFLW